MAYDSKVRQLSGEQAKLDSNRYVQHQFQIHYLLIILAIEAVHFEQKLFF